MYRYEFIFRDVAGERANYFIINAVDNLREFFINQTKLVDDDSYHNLQVVELNNSIDYRKEVASYFKVKDKFNCYNFCHLVDC